MELKNISFDKSKLLSTASMVLGIAGVVVSSMVKKNDNDAIKSELRKELLEELSKSK